MESVHQAIIDEAYEKHREAIDQGFGVFLLALDVVPRDAVVIGKLNQQVCNGGYEQWIDNGYHELSRPFLTSALKKIGTAASRRVLELTSRVLAEHDRYGLPDETRDEGDWAWHRESNTAYYELTDQFVADCEAYFAKVRPSGT